jgi:hypothetical protein
MAFRAWIPVFTHRVHTECLERYFRAQGAWRIRMSLHAKMLQLECQCGASGNYHRFTAPANRLSAPAILSAASMP